MDTFRGTRTLQSFSTRWVDPDILEKTLVGRRELVDRLEELAIDGAGGANKHQRLIIGVRGSGKTHVLRVLHHRLWRNEELKKRLLIVYLLEDELGVAAFLDFVVRLLRAIVNWYPEEQQLARELERVYDLPLEMQERQAVHLLLQTAGSKDVLIIMENLGLTFDKTRGFGREGQQALRDLVQSHPHFMIFASCQALMEGIREQNAPFFGFFKIIHLRRLNLEESMAFLLAIASAYGKQDVVDFLNTPRGRGRTRAIYDFTGGNHRLLVTFYEFISADSVAKLSELFIEALDPLKPFYQEQMRSLSAQQQKIVQFLSLQRTPQSVKDIARGCLAAPNTISSQLADLLNRGFVARIERGRESYYEITETLFRICYEADLEQKGAPVRLFVDFLANLYTAQELQLRRRGFEILAEKMGNSGSVPFADEARFYSQALSLYHPGAAAAATAPAEVGPGPEDKIRSFFRDLEKQSAYREVIEFARHLGEDKDAFILHSEAVAYAHLGRTEQAVVSAEKALEKDPNDVEAHLLLAMAHAGDPGRRETALPHARRAHDLAPGDPRTLAIVGGLVGDAGDHSAALKYFEDLTNEHPKYADGWRLRGQALGMLGREHEAEALYRKALELDPANPNAMGRLGVLAAKAGKYAEALGRFEGLNNARPEYSDGWRLTAQVLEELGRKQEAEGLYRKALELDPANAEAIERLGILAFNAGRHAEALQQFEALNSTRPEYSDGWRLRAQALEELGRKQEAEALYRKALELDPANVNAMQQLGILFLSTGRCAQALEQFQAVNNARPEYSAGWQLTARTLQMLGRKEEAEAPCRKALELDPANADVMKQLGIVFLSAHRYAEALEQFQAVNNARPDYSVGWRLTAQALHVLGRKREAEALYCKALEVDAANADAMEWLGILLLSSGRSGKALEQFQALNTARPGYSDGWLLTGQALQALGRDEEAEAPYRKALELHPTSAVAWEGLSTILEHLGRTAEAGTAFEQAVRLGADRASLFNSRGEARRTRGEYQSAITDYEEALRADPSAVAPHFNIVSALLALGRTDEALSNLRNAIEADRKSASPAGELVTQSFHENCMALFENAVPDSFASYLTAVLELVDGTAYLGRFDGSLPMTVFALLRDRAKISEERFGYILLAFEEVVGKRIDVTVAVRFLRVGIAHFKRNDRKALLELPREERLMFCRELGIEEPST